MSPWSSQTFVYLLGISYLHNGICKLFLRYKPPCGLLHPLVMKNGIIHSDSGLRNNTSGGCQEDHYNRNIHEAYPDALQFLIWCFSDHAPQYRLFQITNLMHNSFIFQRYVCYTTLLNMFRAARCSSSGRQIVSPQPLVSSPAGIYVGIGWC